MQKTKTHHADGRAKASKRIWVYRGKTTNKVYVQTEPLLTPRFVRRFVRLIGEYKLVKEGRHE